MLQVSCVVFFFFTLFTLFFSLRLLLFDSIFFFFLYNSIENELFIVKTGAVRSLKEIVFGLFVRSTAKVFTFSSHIL